MNNSIVFCDSTSLGSSKFAVQLAFVRLLTSMRTHMRSQLAGNGEFLATQSTIVRLFSSMCPHVNDKISSSPGGVHAFCAFEWAVSGVSLSVFDEILFEIRRVVALGTIKFFCKTYGK
jgi:hypothetical protein